MNMIETIDQFLVGEGFKRRDTFKSDTTLRYKLVSDEGIDLLIIDIATKIITMTHESLRRYVPFVEIPDKILKFFDGLGFELHDHYKRKNLSITDWFKAEDSVDAFKTIIDQDFYPLYSRTEAKDVTELVSQAPVIKETPSYKMVQIDYPVIEGIFSLGGKRGAHNDFVEAGRKAFVRNGIYRSPEGWTCTIQYMSPQEYIEKCWTIFVRLGSKLSLEEMIETRRNYDLEEVFAPLTGDLNLPVLDYHNRQQEGLHRTLFAMDRGIKKIPVVVIK